MANKHMKGCLTSLTIKVMPIKTSKRYHYVPPCPRCGSKKTGRFLFMMNTYNGVEKAISDCMANGELVKIRTSFQSQYENAYCEDCGCEWNANIQDIPATEEQIRHQMDIRGITKESVESVKNIRKITKKSIKDKKKSEKAMKKQEKKEKREKLKQEKQKIKNRRKNIL